MKQWVMVFCMLFASNDATVCGLKRKSRQATIARVVLLLVAMKY
jgi:hypothetical protein